MPIVVQIGPKWDKSGNFSDQIQYILTHMGANLTHFGSKSGHQIAAPGPGVVVVNTLSGLNQYLVSSVMCIPGFCVMPIVVCLYLV